MRILLMLILVLALTQPGCAKLKIGKKNKAVPEKAQAQRGAMTLIGMIEMVNPEQRYVLIRCEQAVGLPAGTELIALDSSGAQSKLVLTPERKGLYLTADIKEGSPNLQNLVMQPRGPASGAGGQTTVPASSPVPASVPAPSSEPAATKLPDIGLTNPFPEASSAPTVVVPLEPPLPKSQP